MALVASSDMYSLFLLLFATVDVSADIIPTGYAFATNWSFELASGASVAGFLPASKSFTGIWNVSPFCTAEFFRVAFTGTAAYPVSSLE